MQGSTSLLDSQWLTELVDPAAASSPQDSNHLEWATPSNNHHRVSTGEHPFLIPHSPFNIFHSDNRSPLCQTEQQAKSGVQDTFHHFIVQFFEQL